MSTRAVARTEWEAFLHTFSIQHHGWIVSITLARAPIGADQPAAQDYRQLVQDVPFRSASVEGDMVVIVLGEGDHDITYRLRAPYEVFVDETETGADRGFSVVNQSGEITVLRFRTPAEPETLDGLAESER